MKTTRNYNAIIHMAMLLAVCFVAYSCSIDDTGKINLKIYEYILFIFVLIFIKIKNISNILKFFIL